MAEKVWKGAAGSTDGQLASNYVGGVAPVSGDVIILDDRAVSGFWTNLDFVTATKNVGLKCRSGYRFTVGSPGNPFIVAPATGLNVEIDSDGGVHFLSVTGDLDFIRMANGAQAIIPGGDLATLMVQEGLIMVQAGATVADGKQLGGDVDLSAHASDTPDWEQSGGRLVTRRTLGTVDSEGQGAEVRLLEDAEIATLLTARAGATFDHRGGDVAELVLRPGGKWTRARATRDATVTDSTFWRGSSVRLQPSGAKTYVNDAGGSNPSTMVGNADLRDLDLLTV